MKYSGKNNEYFEIDHNQKSSSFYNDSGKENHLSILWFEEQENLIEIDGREINVPQNGLVCLTAFHKIDIKESKKVKWVKFNKPFYCILDHDSEVGCKGILFFGAQNLPIIHPSDKDLEVLSTVWKMIQLEMESRDNLQLEMLQMMLKRLLILCTRIYKNQEEYTHLDKVQSDLVREYNFLVEEHFRTKHSVGEYANLLNKSPKTLSNLFGKVHHETPLQMIQNRIMLEARRLLKYSDKNISEIADEIGFLDLQSFSRFFKKHENQSPSEFRAA